MKKKSRLHYGETVNKDSKVRMIAVFEEIKANEQLELGECTMEILFPIEERIECVCTTALRQGVEYTVSWVENEYTIKEEKTNVPIDSVCVVKNCTYDSLYCIFYSEGQRGEAIKLSGLDIHNDDEKELPVVQAIVVSPSGLDPKKMMCECGQVISKTGYVRHTMTARHCKAMGIERQVAEGFKACPCGAPPFKDTPKAIERHRGTKRHFEWHQKRKFRKNKSIDRTDANSIADFIETKITEFQEKIDVMLDVIRTHGLVQDAKALGDYVVLLSPEFDIAFSADFSNGCGARLN